MGLVGTKGWSNRKDGRDREGGRDQEGGCDQEEVLRGGGSGGRS